MNRLHNDGESSDENDSPTGYRSAVISDYSIDYCYAISAIPTTFQQAIRSPDADRWMAAMQEEVTALEENDTYELKPLPKGRKCIDGRWVYSVKPGMNNEPKFKARYVAKGFSEVKNVDYETLQL